MVILVYILSLTFPCRLLIFVNFAFLGGGGEVLFLHSCAASYRMNPIQLKKKSINEMLKNEGKKKIPGQQITLTSPDKSTEK